MPEREASVAKALVTGYKSDIPSETRDTYIRLGISHVLAVFRTARFYCGTCGYLFYDCRF